MSLVGPRPEIPVFVEHFKENVPLYMIKHYVKPGMTGLAQIKGFRGDTSIEARIHEDIQYIENWSIGLDIYILLKTPLKAINKNERYVDAPDTAEADPKAAELIAAGEQAEREEALRKAQEPKGKRHLSLKRKGSAADVKAVSSPDEAADSSQQVTSDAERGECVQTENDEAAASDNGGKNGETDE
jgi:hypothetical protein